MESSNEDRINENKIVGSEIDKINRCLYKVCKSVCKIRIKNKIGSGFLIKLYRENNPFYCLMTCEHLIKKEAIELSEKMEIYYDNQYERREIELNKNERYIRDYLYMNIDAVVIEIIKEDNINEIYFLLPNIEYINGYEIYLNKEIYIAQYPGGGE